MPVYLEGFDFVIKPSIYSLEAAIAAYRAEGGSASIFVNDDGLQLLNDEDRCEALPFPCMHASTPCTQHWLNILLPWRWEGDYI